MRLIADVLSRWHGTKPMASRHNPFAPTFTTFSIALMAKEGVTIGLGADGDATANVKGKGRGKGKADAAPEAGAPGHNFADGSR